jgi:rhodanese-related sulfurtransferase
MEALAARPELVERTERVTAASLAEQLSGTEAPLVVDVRSPGEWQEQRIGLAVNVPLSRLSDCSRELARDRAIVVYCTSGYRSAIAASLLTQLGFARVADLVGGLAAWNSSRLPTAA